MWKGNIEMGSRLLDLYKTKVIAQMSEEFGIKNPMALPMIEKVVVNAGVGELSKSKDSFDKFTAEMAALSGQRPSVRNAKVSIAGFNLRAGMPVGVSATIRGPKAYAFLDKLISIVLPRLRDFRGISAKSFDKGGNYSLGIAEHTVFPEVDQSKVEKPRSMEITVVVKNGNPEKSKRLLELLGMPFEKEDK